MEERVHLPDAWSDWTVTELIGSGSFGTVYRAERKLQGKTITSAIKVISVPPENDHSGTILHEAHGKEEAYTYYHEIVEDFEREIHSMDALKGITNIVSIEDYAVEKQTDRVGWKIYLRMEYLQCFTDYQAEHLLTEDDVIRLGIDICTALSYCEKAKILHRDVKPENIFVSQYGNFKLGDFGISRTCERSAGTYSQSGTELYMAPEVVHKQRYGASVDQYSLGLVLYILMNRNRAPLVPVDRQLPGYRERKEALQKRLDGTPLPPPRDADPDFSRIILKACAYDPKDRYPSADDMGRDLKKLQEEREKGEDKELKTKQDKTRRNPKVSRKALRISLIALVLASVGIFVFIISQIGPEPLPKEEEILVTEGAVETPLTSDQTEPATDDSGEDNGASMTGVSLYQRLDRYVSDKYLYFISEDQKYGMYFDDSVLTIEVLKDGRGDYSVFRGGYGDIARGSYKDDGSTIVMEQFYNSSFAKELSDGKTLSIPYRLHVSEYGTYLEATLGSLGKMKFNIKDSTNYFSISDVFKTWFS